MLLAEYEILCIRIKKVIESWLERVYNCVGTMMRSMKSTHKIGDCLHGSCGID